MATWFYILIWYPTLLALDGAVALSGSGDAGGFRIFGRPAYTLALFGWSVVFWLVFEALNLRLHNWYYVFLPPEPVARWLAIVVSFATVIPAVLVVEALLGNAGVAEHVRWPALRWSPGRLSGLRVAGLVMLALPMLWPHWFFPLVWGFTTLLLEPYVYRRAPRRSLLADLEAGRPARLLRLLLAGLCVGLLWELYNSGAHGRWIYTVPFFEHWKLFEMPAPGFLGFAPFAVDCFVAWQALVVSGLAAGRRVHDPDDDVAPAARIAAAALALAFSVLVIAGMERWTIASTEPRLSGLPGAPAGVLRAAGYDVFSLAAARPAAVGRAAGVAADSALPWVREARLATLRGIGTEREGWLRQVGIRSVPQLAAVDPDRLTARLDSAGHAAVPARVRVWVRAARAAVQSHAAAAARGTGPPAGGAVGGRGIGGSR